ncbi:hypothetical protein R3P38DRAFT_3296444 [Favolaschia claudopus]|uniref:Uncharacterized protein n=1 Tax=Favolaschia claudopus TaxID=2862362 RepID=A0AAV9Z8U0_9AGAR
MPVERSRGSRRTCADGDGYGMDRALVPPGISLATNLTPGAWDESSQAMPCMIYKFSVEHNLKPSAPNQQHSSMPRPPQSRAKSHRHKHKHPQCSPIQENHTRKPATRALPTHSSFSAQLSSAPVRSCRRRDLSRLALCDCWAPWAALPALEKAAWHRKAEEERKRHLERFPAYAPASGSSDRDRYVGRGSGKGGLAAVVARPNRRKQREVVPPDCTPEGRLEESDPAPLSGRGAGALLCGGGVGTRTGRKSEEGKDGRCTLPPPLSPSTPIDPEASTATFAFDSDFDLLSSVPAIAPNTGFASTWSFPSTYCRLFRPTANDEFTSTFEWPPLNKSSSSPFFNPSYLFSHAFQIPPHHHDVSSFCRSLEDLSLINPFPQQYSVGPHTGQPSPVLGCSSMFAIGGDPNSLTSSPDG